MPILVLGKIKLFGLRITSLLVVSTHPFWIASLDHPKYRRALKSIGTTGWTTNHFLIEYLCGITILLWTAANSFCVSQKEGFTQIFPNGGPNRGSEGLTNLAIGCIKASILGVQSFWQFLTTQMTRVWQLRSTFQVDYVHLSRANHHEGTWIFDPTERAVTKALGP